MVISDVLRRLLRRSAGPRIRSRSLPAIDGRVPGEARERGPEKLVVAGRVYWVEERAAVNRICPWCLTYVEDGQDAYQCPIPTCRQVAHRRHVKEYGACGGICSFTG